MLKMAQIMMNKIILMFLSGYAGRNIYITKKLIDEYLHTVIQSYRWDYKEESIN